MTGTDRGGGRARDADEGQHRRAAGDDADRPRGGDDVESGRSIGFGLPPIRLPPLFPDGVRLVLPWGGQPDGPRPHRRLAAAVALDLVDASLALAIADPAVALVRVVGGAAVALLLAGQWGLLYGGEAAALALGAPRATAFPTLTASVLGRLLRERDPEQVE